MGHQRSPGEAFDAFISYNHAADARLAEQLRNGLQKFAKRWNQRRAMRVFLDRSSLELTGDLDDALQQKLGAARYLILLASAESADSRWCDAEAAYWIREKSPKTLILVLTDDDASIVWDHEAGRFDPALSTALPPSLLEGFPTEPLWLDMAWVETQGEEAVLDVRSSQFRDAVATLSATIQGKPKDELDGEDVRQHQRFRRIRAAAVGVLAVLTVLATIAAVVAVDRADAARRGEAIGQAQRAEAAADRDMRQALIDAAAVYARIDDPEVERMMVQLLNDTNRLEMTRDLDATIVDAVPVGDVTVWGLDDGRVGTIDAVGAVTTIDAGSVSVSGLTADSVAELVAITWEDGSEAMLDVATGAVDRSRGFADLARPEEPIVDLAMFGPRGRPEDQNSELILDLDDRSTDGAVMTFDFESRRSFRRDHVFFHDARLSDDSERVVVLSGALLEVWEVLDSVQKVLEVAGVDPTMTSVELDHTGRTAVTWGGTRIQRWNLAETNEVLLLPEQSPGGALDAVISARVEGSEVQWSDGGFGTQAYVLDLDTMARVDPIGAEGDRILDELGDRWREPAPAGTSDGSLRARYSDGTVTVTEPGSAETVRELTVGRDPGVLVSYPFGEVTVADPATLEVLDSFTIDRFQRVVVEYDGESVAVTASQRSDGYVVSAPTYPEVVVFFDATDDSKTTVTTNGSEVTAPISSDPDVLRRDDYVDGRVTFSEHGSVRTIAEFESASDGLLFFDDRADHLVMALRGGGLQVWALDVARRCGALNDRIGPDAARPVCTAADARE